jgi:DNA-binding response OmpR family regulator
MIRKQILFTDNDSDFLNTRAEFLERLGYHILKAFSLAEARHYLDEARIHLAILDIRMTDDDDEKDVSGLTLAKDPAYHSIPKIILTNFPAVPTAKVALQPVLEGISPAVDYVDKKDGPDVMIQAVNNAFITFVKINWDLDIQWDAREPLTFPHLVSLVQPGLSDEILIYRASELEDLLRRLFFDYRHIRLGQILWYDNRRFCLPALTQSSEGLNGLRILVCGEREMLQQDKRNLEGLAPDVLQGTEFKGHAETVHFGANLYGLPGAQTETMQTLRDLFQVGRERPLKQAIANLLEEVLKYWHGHSQSVDETGDLMFIYRQLAGLAETCLPRTEVENHLELLLQAMQGLGGVKIKRLGSQVIFTFPAGLPISFPDPLAAVYSPLPSSSTSLVYKVSPGNLTADNILVDAQTQTWLTDFASARQAPQWWDFVCLEAVIRFDLCQAPDLLAWQEFEECLVRPARLDQKLEQTDAIPVLRTGIALIEQIRLQAARETGSDPLPYYAGLLAWAVKAMAHYQPGVLYTQTDRLRSVHLLLSASMLAQRLAAVAPADVPSPTGLLRLDEDGRVWIGARRVATLAGLSQKLLACLFAHAGQIVNNRMIVEAYGERYSEGDTARDQRIRQEVSRLREDIEPDPEHPRYILTERGKGYRLEISGESDS